MKSPHLSEKNQYIALVFLSALLSSLVFLLPLWNYSKWINYLNTFSILSFLLCYYLSSSLYQQIIFIEKKNKELSQLKSRAEKLSFIDDLTGLYNFRYLKHYLSMEIKKALRYKHNLALLILDIDNFKNYNDCNGHSAGNNVLTQFAKILKNSCRDTDIIARYGGEEFVIVLPETNTNEAMLVAEKIRSNVESNIFPLEHTQPKGKVTVSIGLAVCPKDALVMEDLFNKADQALYWAKDHGRNKTILYCKHLA